MTVWWFLCGDFIHSKMSSTNLVNPCLLGHDHFIEKTLFIEKSFSTKFSLDENSVEIFGELGGTGARRTPYPIL